MLRGYTHGGDFWLRGTAPHTTSPPAHQHPLKHAPTAVTVSEKALPKTVRWGRTLPTCPWHSLPWACRQGKRDFKENEVAAVTDGRVPWGGEWAGYI